MRRTELILIVGGMILSGVVAGFAAGQESGTKARELAEAAAKEEFLRTAPIITVTRGGTGGRTAALKVYLKDGEKASLAIFKYVDRRRPRPFPSSYHYELAAYSLSRLLGVTLVPPTVERTVQGMAGSLQCFCEGVITEDARRRQGLVPSDVRPLQDAFSEVGIFENLSGNPRIQESDILIRVQDWKVWRVDFSEAFAPDTSLYPDSRFSRCSKDVYLKLRETPDEEFRGRLAPYLNQEEIEALLVRKGLILKELESLIKEKGEAAVLF